VGWDQLGQIKTGVLWHALIITLTNYTVSDPKRSTGYKKKSFVTYDAPTSFGLYKVILWEVYTKAHKDSKLCKKCKCVELKHNNVN
jgi:hypothetical protein